MTTSSDNDLYAAIDLGSNSFHMIVAREVHGQLQVVDKHKEMVRLRSGLDGLNNLSENAVTNALECLERFGQLIKNIPSQNVRAVGTNTLRNANNSRAFLIAARKALGHHIEIISGQEEARLIFLGVVHGLPSSDEQRLIMDIGGGSTEYIIGRGFNNNHLTSTEMGCVSFSSPFFDEDIVTTERMNNAIASARQILRPHRRILTNLGWDAAYGASGTIKSIGILLQENGWTDGHITLDGLQALRGEMIKAGSVQELKLNGLKDDRRPVLAAGLAILIATFDELNIQQMQVSSNALREGLVFDTLGRMFAEDSREASVRAMQTWMKVDTQQALHVAQSARKFFNQAHNIWHLHDSEYDYPKLLEWACQLHECGMALSYKRYRHHSAYLIEQSDMAGFTNQEKQMLAAMLLNHRGKFVVEAFENLLEPHNQKLIFLTVLLRLAVRIHRGRDLEVPEILLMIQEGHAIHLKFEEDWLKNHPLSLLDLEIEAKRLEAAGFSLSFA